MTHNVKDSIRGGILGHLIGDALGVPYEFTDPRFKRLPSYDEIEFKPPMGFDRAHKGIRPGTWSDDGSQMLCVLESLLKHDGRFNAFDIEQKLIRWLYENYMAVDNNTFDCGMQTLIALSQAKRVQKPVIPPRSADGKSTNGNGSLMRALPLALFDEISDEDLISQSMKLSAITHGHIQSQLCCALYTMWARCILHMFHVDDAWDEAVIRVESRFPEGDGHFELQDIINYQGIIGGTGYVVDCLHSARAANKQDSYEAVVKAAILFGHDTDTTAAVAGGIAGIRFGVDGIPKRWRENLRGREILEPILDRLACYHYVNFEG